MAGRKVAVVLSQAPGKSPPKRHLEEALAAELLLDAGVEVSIVPHLYDIPGDDTGLLFLRGVASDLIVLAWLYPRATRWVLDRQGVRGQIGVSLLDKPADEDDADEESETGEPPTVAGAPERKIYCLDLRDHPTAEPYLQEIRRIVRERQTPVVTVGIGGLNANGSNGKPSAAPPATGNSATFLNVLTGQATTVAPTLVSNGGAGAGNLAFDGRNGDVGKRRWYPVIDYTRCTNCMECIDFCLFGVYGIDAAERILVEQQDNCKKGCPACSRVCPENAIIFPEYKSPAIAGAAVGGATGIKIDLSKLFGGGDGASALDLAVAERDHELVADGREAVGAAVGLPKRHQGKPVAPKDDLDALMDGLDDLDL
jgi:hypothetical protein